MSVAWVSRTWTPPLHGRDLHSERDPSSSRREQWILSRTGYLDSSVLRSKGTSEPARRSARTPLSCSTWNISCSFPCEPKYGSSSLDGPGASSGRTRGRSWKNSRTQTDRHLLLLALNNVPRETLSARPTMGLGEPYRCVVSIIQYKA